MICRELPVIARISNRSWFDNQRIQTTGTRSIWEEIHNQKFSKRSAWLRVGGCARILRDGAVTETGDVARTRANSKTPLPEIEANEDERCSSAGESSTSPEGPRSRHEGAVQETGRVLVGVSIDVPRGRIFVSSHRPFRRPNSSLFVLTTSLIDGRGSGGPRLIRGNSH
jgi:hypothetical protein